MSERTYFTDYGALVARFGDPAGGRAALEELDVAGLAALRGQEREEALAVLHEHLAALENDPRVVDALVAMQAPDLEALLRVEMHRRDETGVAAARAAWEQTKDPAAVTALIETLVKARKDSARESAAVALADTRSSAAAEALLAALDSDDDAARNVVITALLRLVGLSELEQLGRSPVSRLGALILNPLGAVRQPAVAELRRIVAAVQAGQSAESLGLVPGPGQESAELARLRESVLSDPRRPGPWRNTLDLEAFGALRGEERERGMQWAYSLLAKGDVRAVRAIAELDLQAAIPVLREAAQRGNRTFAEAAQAALAQLSEPS